MRSKKAASKNLAGRALLSIAPATMQSLLAHATLGSFCLVSLKIGGLMDDSTVRSPSHSYDVAGVVAEGKLVFLVVLYLSKSSDDDTEGGSVVWLSHLGFHVTALGGA